MNIRVFARTKNQVQLTTSKWSFLSVFWSVNRILRLYGLVFALII